MPFRECDLFYDFKYPRTSKQADIAGMDSKKRSLQLELSL